VRQSNISLPHTPLGTVPAAGAHTTTDKDIPRHIIPRRIKKQQPQFPTTPTFYSQYLSQFLYKLNPHFVKTYNLLKNHFYVKYILAIRQWRIQKYNTGSLPVRPYKISGPLRNVIRYFMFIKFYWIYILYTYCIYILYIHIICTICIILYNLSYTYTYVELLIIIFIHCITNTVLVEQIDRIFKKGD